MNSVGALSPGWGTSRVQPAIKAAVESPGVAATGDQPCQDRQAETCTARRMQWCDPWAVRIKSSSRRLVVEGMVLPAAVRVAVGLMPLVGRRIVKKARQREIA